MKQIYKVAGICLKTKISENSEFEFVQCLRLNDVACNRLCADFDLNENGKTVHLFCSRRTIDLES